VFSIKHFNLGITEETVPAFGSMEERVGVTDVCPSEPDNPGKDTSARVRRKPDDKVPDEIIGFFNIIEWVKSVAFDKQVVHELRNVHHIFSARIGDEKILRMQFHNLRSILEIISQGIFDVAERAEFFNGNPHLVGTDMGERQVDHIKPRGSILENKDVLNCPQDSLLHRLNGFFPGYDSLYSLHECHTI